MYRIVFALSLIAAAGPAVAGSTHERFVTETARRMDALRDGPASARTRGCSLLNRQSFDLDAVAHASAGRLWAGMTKNMRAAFRDAVGVRLTAECESALKRPYAGPPAIRRITDKNGLTKVTVLHVDADGKQSVVTWSLVPGGPFGMRAVDIIADGRGATATLKADFEGALAGNGGNIETAIHTLAGMR